MDTGTPGTFPGDALQRKSLAIGVIAIDYRKSGNQN